MNFLNSKEIESGARSMCILASVLIPLGITYRLHSNLAVAIPAAAVLWLAIAALWRMAWQPWERRSARLEAESIERWKAQRAARAAKSASEA